MTINYLNAISNLQIEALKYILQVLIEKGDIDAAKIDERFQIMYIDRMEEPKRALIESIYMEGGRIAVFTSGKDYIKQDELTMNDFISILYIIELLDLSIPGIMYRCCDCNSTEITVKMWQNPNTLIKSFEFSLDEDDMKNSYCDKCKKYVPFEEIEPKNEN